jgi:hypothetical protein
MIDTAKIVLSLDVERQLTWMCRFVARSKLRRSVYVCQAQADEPMALHVHLMDETASAQELQCSSIPHRLTC